MRATPPVSPATTAAWRRRREASTEPLPPSAAEQPPNGLHPPDGQAGNDPHPDGQSGNASHPSDNHPGNGLHPSANTTEVYGQLSYGPVYAKYSYALTDLFGAANSKGSGYLDLGANFDVTNGYTINVHAGHQTVSNSSNLSYTDWKFGVTKDFGVLTGALAVIGTNTNSYVGPAPDNKNLGKTSLVLSISKTF